VGGDVADRRVANVVCLVAWPVLTVSALWEPADWVMTGLVVGTAVVIVGWWASRSWGQQLSLWWETVKRLRPAGRAR
jgi:hypothetical protein